MHAHLERRDELRRVRDLRAVAVVARRGDAVQPVDRRHDGHPRDVHGGARHLHRQRRAPARRGMAMAIYTIAVLVAPVLGPTLGGWITDNYSWRWIFYINIPVGCLSLFLTQMVLDDPPYLKAKRAAQRGKPLSVDFTGL